MLFGTPTRHLCNHERASITFTEWAVADICTLHTHLTGAWSLLATPLRSFLLFFSALFGFFFVCFAVKPLFFSPFADITSVCVFSGAGCTRRKRFNFMDSTICLLTQILDCDGETTGNMMEFYFIIWWRIATKGKSIVVYVCIVESGSLKRYLGRLCICFSKMRARINLLQTRPMSTCLRSRSCGACELSFSAVCPFHDIARLFQNECAGHLRLFGTAQAKKERKQRAVGKTVV